MSLPVLFKKSYFLAFLTVLSCNAPAHSIDSPEKPDVTVLESITKRGRMLAEYDSVVAVSTDAVRKLREKDGHSGGAGFYLAEKRPQGWFVSFGRFNDKGDAFRIDYQSAYLDKSIEAKDAASLLQHPDEERGILYHMAKAVETCQKIRPPLRNYNYAVLPTQTGQYYVYFFPGSTTDGEYVLGGDDRYTVSSDGCNIVETRHLHKGILPFNSKNFDEGKKVTAGFHIAVLHDLPEDTDVMHVMMRRPRIPEFIGAGAWIFKVDTEGLITIEGPLNQPGAAPGKPGVKP